MRIRKSTSFFVLGLCATASALMTRSAMAEPSYPITVLGGDETSFTPALSPSDVVNDPKHYDAVVVGAGLSGLSSAVYLSDQGKQVILIEKEATLGGLASSGRTQSGIRYDRGAAYWTSAYEEEQQ